MSDWNDGYVSDIAYAEGFHFQQTPAHLDAACLISGVEPPVGPDAPFTYCELGCGLGDTAMVVAAGNRRGRVWGFDFNPAHIAHARAVAARTGLDNVHFAERSFEELAQAPPADLPAFDYVTLHGVWSWVSRAAQGHIAAFLRAHVRPGGLVSVSYNAMPAWAGSIALQRLIFETGRAAGGDSQHRMQEAFALARRMAEVGGSAIDGEAFKRVAIAMEGGHLSYAVHEYMNEHWRPAFFADVAAALAPAKLDYVGSANLIENFPTLCMREKHRALVESLPREQRQTVQDFFCPRAFRRDVFVRGPRRLPANVHRTRLDAQRLALTVPGHLADLKFEIPLGEATLEASFYRPALATLADGIATIGDLRAAAAPAAAPAADEILGLLAGGKQVVPAPGPADADAVAQARRYNRRRLTMRAEEALSGGWIVGSVPGTAIRVGLVEMLVYEVVARRAETGESAADTVSTAVLALLKERGMSLKTDAPETEEGLTAEVGTIVSDWVPIWRRLGAF